MKLIWMLIFLAGCADHKADIRFDTASEAYVYQKQMERDIQSNHFFTQNQKP